MLWPTKPATSAHRVKNRLRPFTNAGIWPCAIAAAMRRVIVEPGGKTFAAMCSIKGKNWLAVLTNHGVNTQTGPVPRVSF